MNLTKNFSSHLTLPFLTLLLICVVATVPTGGQSCTPLDGTEPAWPRNSTVYVNLGNLNTEQRRQVTAAINSWNQANQSNGSYVSFSFNAPPLSTSFRLNFQIGQTIPPTLNSPPPAAQINTSGGVDSQGNLNRATVTFNTNVQAPDQDGNLVQQLDENASSVSFLKAALHEIGHSMGFGDGQLNPAQPTSGPCGQYGQISGSTVMNGMCGANDWGGNMPTAVTSCDNQRVPTVNQYQCNLSAATCSPRSFDPASCLCYDPDPPSPGCWEQQFPCQWWEEWSVSECRCVGYPPGGYPPGSPVLIDVSGDAFNLTSNEDGIRFDLDNNGVKEKLSWTSYGSDDAWLALDRNSNGTIDNGAELFGDFTPQTESVSPNGFIALAEFDKPDNGGNADGVISHNDAIFSSLRLWQDKNHNGISESSELHTLGVLNVESISLDFKEARRIDRYGNQFLYRAKITNNKGVQLGRWAWDVFLVRAE